MNRITGVALVLFSGCGVGSSSNVAINGLDLQYVKDPRTESCFAYVGSSMKMSLETTGLGLASVPCDKVPKELLK